MKLSTFPIIFSTLFLSHSLQAECMSDMPIQELMDCITIESTGVNYQQWKADIAARIKQESSDNVIADNGTENTTPDSQP